MHSKNLEERLSSLVVSLIGMIGITRICTPYSEYVFENEGEKITITMLTVVDEVTIDEKDFLRTLLNPILTSSSGKSDS